MLGAGAAFRSEALPGCFDLLCGGAEDEELLQEVGVTQRATSSVQVSLPNAQAALEYQQSMIGAATGRYNAMTNSCLTHCANVLSAGGGEGVPTSSPFEVLDWLAKQQ